MKRRQIVLEGDAGAPQPPLQPADLRDPARHLLPGGREPYLTAVEAAAYVRRPTLPAFYEWRKRHNVRAYRPGLRGPMLFRARDLDEALKPVAERGRRHFFASVRGGRA